MQNHKNDFYATQKRLATYLEMEWSDYLLPPKDIVSNYPLNQHQILTGSVLPVFYQNICRTIRTYLEQVQVNPSRYCDVGGGTGRTIYEINKIFPELKELFYIEPSKLFFDWANRLLLGSQKLPKFPIVSGVKNIQTASVYSKPEPVATPACLTLLNNSVEDAFLTDSYFDLVTCLNVIDRHPKPTILIEYLYKLVRLKGILVLSSPLDFKEDYTAYDHWLEDLNEVFDAKKWRIISLLELPYEFRYSQRALVRLSCQVVITQKLI